jgi:tRNA-modifying protein YgfZ
MAPLGAPTDELAAIEGGRALARPDGLRIVRVTGADATAWLHDLVTADIESLEPGQARRSLLLTPTGRIRADFMVGRDADGIWLLQAGDQPNAVHDLLAIYVLSSDVVLTDTSAERSVSSLLDGAADRAGALGMRPSVLGPGCDLVRSGTDLETPWPVGSMPDDLVLVGPDAVERWRILHGDPRMGSDFEEGALPSAVGLDAAIDATKGCFLGQESVAKIRNLGHPPTVLRHRQVADAVVSGSPVFDAGADVGSVTSAASDVEGDTVAIIRVAWASRDAVLTTADGVPFLERVD